MSGINQNSSSAHMGMLLWAAIVGMSFPAVGLMSEGLPPLLLTALRFAIASLALWPLVQRLPKEWPGIRGMALYTLMGVCLSLFFGTMFWAAHRTTAISMATLYVSVPLAAYFLGRMVGVEQKAGGLLAILALGAAGALTLALAEAGGKLGQLQFGFPEALYFIGCLATALYPVLSKWGLQRGWLSKQPAVRTFWSLVVGSIMIGLLGLSLESPARLSAMTLPDMLLLVYLGIFSSGVTFWLMQRATLVLTPGVLTSYTYLIPFASMLLLFVRQPESIGWHWLPGSLLVLLATSLLIRRDTATASGTGSTNRQNHFDQPFCLLEERPVCRGSDQ